MTTSQFLPIALDAVKAAETVIKKYVADGFEVHMKPDQTPVTIADQQAEKIIKEIIHRAFPDHGFLGEEEGVSDETAEWTWVIDPIDGTKNFVRGLPFFGTQLALMHGDQIVLGVSNLPMLGELAYAEKDGGAFLNEQPLHVSQVNQLTDSYLSFASLKYFEQHGHLENLLQLCGKCRAHRGFGDCWSYHLLAKGAIDIVLESQLKIWDIAAATIIVREAGGTVTELSGQPITKNSTTIMASNGVLHAQVREFFE